MISSEGEGENAPKDEPASSEAGRAGPNKCWGSDAPWAACSHVPPGWVRGLGHRASSDLLYQYSRPLNLMDVRSLVLITVIALVPHVGVGGASAGARKGGASAGASRGAGCFRLQCPPAVVFVVQGRESSTRHRLPNAAFRVLVWDATAEIRKTITQ